MEANTKSTEQTWSNPEAPLLDRIRDYIKTYGPTKVSRLRDRLVADSKAIADQCEILEGRCLLVRVKPGGVNIWAAPKSVAEFEEAYLVQLGLSPHGAYADSFVVGRNADERQFRRGVLYRLRDRGLIEIDAAAGQGGFCRLLKEA